MSAMLRDLRYAARTLLRSPGFTLVVVATLALGIGANTAIFSVVNAVLLDALPYEEPNELVAAWLDVSARGGPVDEWLNYEDFAALAEEPNLLESAATWSGWQPTLVGAGDPEVIEGALISHEMLGAVLGAEPHLGRFFRESDDVPGAAGVVVLSYDAWERRFSADPAVLGRSLTLSDNPYTVVGVAPPGFRIPVVPEAEVYRAMGILGPPGCGRGNFCTRGIGRLAPGVTLDLARERARDLGARLERAYPDTNTNLTFTMVGLREQLIGGSAAGLWVLLGAVGLVLLIACTNVANLLLVRGAAREGEIGVRVALGAGRAPVLRQLLSETLVLAVLGGVAGLVMASWVTDALVSLAPAAALPRGDEVALDGPVLLFTVAVTLLTGVLFGLVPSWRASRPGLYVTVRSQAAGLSARARLRNGLVVAEVGTALVLLVGAGLLLESFQRLSTMDLGFDDPERVLTFRVALPRTRYDPDERLAFFSTLVERVESIPGVEAAGAVNALPLGGVNSDTDFAIEGDPPAEAGVSQAVWLRATFDGYFDAMGFGVIEGRGLSASDDERATPVIVVNGALARRYFQGGAIGRRISFGGNPPTWWTIVGVARDVRHFAIREGVAAGPDPTATADAPAAYMSYRQSYRQFGPGTMSVAARVEGDPAALIPQVRRTLAELDPTLAASRIQPLQAFVDEALARDRFVTLLLTAFATTALLLSAVGIYGVVSYGVSLRMREMGIRRALGAETAEIGLMIVRGGVRLAATGIAAGVVGSLLVTRVLQSLLYGVEATDLTTFVATALLLAGVATLTSWLPTRRIGRVDPVSVLRSD